jgi:hypothetical protein
MTRKDFEFLARTFYLVLVNGELKPMTARVMMNEMDNNYSNFNRSAFEDKAVPDSLREEFSMAPRKK